MKKIRGTVWTFGDNIDTDVIIPARYLMLPLEEMKAHAMAPIRPGFAAAVRPGDVLVAGRNFGCGSSREQAPAVLKELGIRAVVAVSFARIFFRNAVNLGLVAMEAPDLYPYAQEKESVEIDPVAGSIYLPEKKKTIAGSRLPDFLLAIVEAGGLIAHLKGGGNRQEASHTSTAGEKVNHR
jgi:3-isopropylmalate/(R)-2-methylmalate dehydratase small subunit